MVWGDLRCVFEVAGKGFGWDKEFVAVLGGKKIKSYWNLCNYE